MQGIFHFGVVHTKNLIRCCTMRSPLHERVGLSHRPCPPLSKHGSTCAISVVASACLPAVNATQAHAAQFQPFD
eukprot:6192395-Pleurochrysis_carterae.AAC.1